jgi:hypothetical protein
MLLTLAYKLDNVCNASFSRHTNHTVCNPKGIRTKINYNGIIPLYIVYVKLLYPIYRF